jgi:hypothetical protein
MSFGKNSNHTQANQSYDQTTNQSQSQQQSQTQTPNNLPQVQLGWNLADALTAPQVPGATTDAVNGLNLTATGANNAADAAAGGLATATNYANGGTANPANAYYAPFADGSLTGNNNPYFAQLLQQISQGAQAATDGNFAASGRYGSGANANAFNSAVVNNAGQLGYQNLSDSLNRQLQGAQGLSTNNTFSTNAAMEALGLIPSIGAAGTGAGQALYQTGVAPLQTFANSLALFGSGGGTANGTASGTANGTTSGTSQGTSTTSGSNYGLNLGSLIQPFSLFK